MVLPRGPGCNSGPPGMDASSPQGEISRDCPSAPWASSRVDGWFSEHPVRSGSASHQLGSSLGHSWGSLRGASPSSAPVHCRWLGQQGTQLSRTEVLAGGTASRCSLRWVVSDKVTRGFHAHAASPLPEIQPREMKLYVHRCSQHRYSQQPSSGYLAKERICRFRRRENYCQVSKWGTLCVELPPKSRAHDIKFCNESLGQLSIRKVSQGQ